MIPFSCLQSFPASGSFQMSQFFASCGQSIGVSASTSVLLMNTQDWFSLGWTGWISLQSKGLFKSLLQHHHSKASIFWRSAFFIVQLSHPYILEQKTQESFLIPLFLTPISNLSTYFVLCTFKICSESDPSPYPLLHYHLYNLWPKLMWWSLCFFFP